MVARKHAPQPETPPAEAAPEEVLEKGTEASAELPIADATPAALTDRPRRRVRIALLLFLVGTAGALLVFSGWYLLFRQPISEFPLPGITAERMPGYEYSLYGMRRPMGIAVSPDGSRIYATQSEGAAAVVVFDNRGTQVTALLPPETGTDHVFVYVAVDPAGGDVYVTDRPMAAIHVYGSDGAYRRTIERPGGLNGWQPLGVSFTPDGHMLVTDAGTSQVHEFAADGSLIRSIGAPGQFNFPNSAIVDATGTMYVADSNNGRLVVLDQSGNQIAVLRRGPYEGDLGLPRGLAVDKEGRIYVADSTDQSVKVYRPATDGSGQPAFLGRFGAHGTDEGAFRFPNAVATDARGRVYVADWSNDRVQVWTY